MKRAILAGILLALLVAVASAQTTEPITLADGRTAILVGNDSAARHGLWGITNKAMLENWQTLKSANVERAPRYVIHSGDILTWPAAWGTIVSMPVHAASDTLIIKGVGQPAATPFLPKWFLVLAIVALFFIGLMVFALTQNHQHLQQVPPAQQPAVPQPGPARQVTVNGGGMNVTVTFAANGAVIVHTQP